GGGIDFVARDAWTQLFRGGFDGMDYCFRRSSHALGRRALAWPTNVPKPLQVGAVSFPFHAQIDMHNLPGPDVSCGRGACVTGLGGSNVHNRAACLFPSAWQAPATKLRVDELG